MDGKRQLLGQYTLSENLDRMATADEPTATEGPNIIGSGFQRLLETLHIEYSEDRAARISESPQLRLPTKKRRLSSFKTKTAPLPCSRMLPFRPPTGGLSSPCADPTANAPWPSARSR